MKRQDELGLHCWVNVTLITESYNGGVIVPQDSCQCIRSALLMNLNALIWLQGETQFWVHLRVPVLFGDFVEAGEHDG